VFDLLRARRERPRYGRAAEQSDEIATFYVEHGDSSPMRYQSRRLAGAQSSAASACRRAAGKSLGQT
jgi:hypothetical protein